MFGDRKRGKGKIVKPLGVRNMYTLYKESAKNPISYKEYARIIKQCNKEIVNIITYEAKVFEMPYRLGVLQVSKFERGFNKPKNSWSVDYSKSKELGFIVYHDQEFIYKFNWKKTKALFLGKTGYKFKANRAASRMIPKALKETKVSYYR